MLKKTFMTTIAFLIFSAGALADTEVGAFTRSETTHGYAICPARTHLAPIKGCTEILPTVFGEYKNNCRIEPINVNQTHPGGGCSVVGLRYARAKRGAGPFVLSTEPCEVKAACISDSR